MAEEVKEFEEKDIVTDDIDRKIGATSEGEQAEGVDEESAACSEDELRGNDKAAKKDSRFLKIVLKVLKKIALYPREIIMGRVISSDFILRNWKTALTVLFIAFFYISNRYTCQQSAANIKKLEREIVELRYKSLDMFTLLKTLQSEDSIAKKIELYNLNLLFPEQPPYIIEEDGKEQTE